MFSSITKHQVIYTLTNIGRYMQIDFMNLECTCFQLCRKFYSKEFFYFYFFQFLESYASFDGFLLDLKPVKTSAFVTLCSSFVCLFLFFQPKLIGTCGRDLFPEHCAITGSFSAPSCPFNLLVLITNSYSFRSTCLT